ncbi:hypothetical protein B0J12DRAFT_734830 [Macrophomina phaseolina]|uniref:Double-stranded RNA-binding protein n=1 Tax=Macrophomina phaseolina TaxID=35725 RepID=A0ABQ8GW95_9PEZI|nr:hypothetical protein B0J12DRAFT_734830 [Macrophomina phaseolina]
MASGAFPQTFPGLGHASSSAQSIEEFEAQMAAAKQLPPASSPSGDSYHTPPPSQARPSQQPSNASPQLQAGRAWSSESVASFNNLCLKNAVANGFEYAQVRLVPPGWSVELKFGFGSLSGEGARYTVSLPGPYGSKKEAKAAAAEEGLRTLTEAIEKRGASGKRKVSASGDGETTRDVEGESEDENENWIGLLGEYSQAEGKPRPLFQEFSLGANYSMECILPADRPGEPFGGRDLLFNSKKAAKANAAREAVRWLRAQDRMPKKGHPTKKKIKAAQLAAAYSAAAQFSASASADPGPLPTPTPIGGDVAIAMAGASNSNAASASDSDGSSGSPDQKDRTPGEQVMLLCSKLGCAQPIYKITPDPRVPSMWSGAAYFPHDPAIAPPGQPIGEVHNIYGKKKAREEVAKRVLKHLKAKRVERQKVAESALAGAGAGAPMVPQV